MNLSVNQTEMSQSNLEGHFSNMRETLLAENAHSLIETIHRVPPHRLIEHKISLHMSTNNKIREANNAYFNLESQHSKVGNRNMVVVVLALLASAATVVFVCNTFLQLLMSNGFMNNFRNLFGG